MIEIDIPTIDPIQHRPKVFLGLDSRQIKFVVPGAIVGIGLAVLLYKFSVQLSVLSLLLFCFPAGLFAFYRPFNMNFEQYLLLMYQNEFVNSKYRVFKSDEAQEIKMQTIKERQEEEARNKKKAIDDKKNKSVVKSQNKKSNESEGES